MLSRLGGSSREDDSAREAGGTPDDAPVADDFALVRRALAAVNARDVEAYLRCCAADVEVVPLAAGMEGTYVGQDGVRRFFAGLHEVSADLELVEERLYAALPGRVVVAHLRAVGTGRASAIPADLSLTNVYELVGGRIRRVSVLSEPDQALALARAAAARATDGLAD